MSDELEDYKSKVHILKKQLEQAERHISELKKMVKLQDEIIDQQARSVINDYNLSIRTKGSNSIIN